MFENYPKDSQPQNWLQRNFKMVIGGAAVLVIIGIVIGFLGWQRAVREEGYTRQINTATLYKAVQTKLSACLDKTMTSVQIADRERTSLKDTLTAVVQARYVDANGNPVDINTAGGQALMIKIVQEAYPTVSNDLFKQLMTIASGCRDEVTGAQLRLQAYAGDFQSWTKGGGPFEGMIREEFPNDELQVEGLNGTLTGKAALRFIAEPISTEEAGKAMRTKVMPQQTLFPSASPTK